MKSIKCLVFGLAGTILISVAAYLAGTNDCGIPVNSLMVISMYFLGVVCIGLVVGISSL